MTLVLRVHVQGAEPYRIGGLAHHAEESLAQAIWNEAETISSGAGSDLLEEDNEECRGILSEQIFNEATARLQRPGDNYRDPAGSLWSLSEDYSDRDATIERVSQAVRERGWTVQRTELDGGAVRINGMTINADGTTTR